MKAFPDDKELVKRLQKGDIEAFDLIYEKYSARLFAFGLKYLKSTDETEELIQSVFVKLWENHKTLRTGLSFKSFIFTITYNDICKLFRRRKYLQTFIDDTLIEGITTTNDLNERMDYNSLFERVQTIISKLPDRQRVIYKKSREEGKSTKEIAQETGLSPGTVDNYLSESLKFIRSRLLNENLPVVICFSLFFR